VKHSGTILKACLPGLLIAAGFVAATVNTGRATEYDENGNAYTPLLCPTALPSAGWVTTFPMQILVPTATWDPYRSGGVGGWSPTAQRIPFQVTSMALTPNIAPVMPGQGWYVPSPTFTSYQGTDFNWEGAGATTPPAVFALCGKKESFFGLLWSTYVFIPGDPLHIAGYAFPLNVGDDGSCGGGGGGDDPPDETRVTRPAGGGNGSPHTLMDCGSGGGDSGLECWSEYVEIQIQFEDDPNWYTVWSGYASVCDYAE